MPSSSKLNRKKLCAEILITRIEIAPYSSYRNAKPKKGESKPKCIVGPRSGRCSECVRKGVPSHQCDVTVTRPEWERLRDGREKLRVELDAAEEKEAELL